MTESSEEIPANLPIFLPALQGWQGHIHHKAQTRGHESKAIQPTKLPAQSPARCPEEQLVALRHAAIVRRVPMEKAATRTETGSKFRRSEMKKNRVLAMTLAVATAGSLAACGSTNTAGVQSTAARRILPRHRMRHRILPMTEERSSTSGIQCRAQTKNILTR